MNSSTDFAGSRHRRKARPDMSSASTTDQRERPIDRQIDAQHRRVAEEIRARSELDREPKNDIGAVAKLCHDTADPARFLRIRPDRGDC